MIPFTGSYGIDDVQFLLEPIGIDDTPIHLKESLIQSGQKHYSEMLSHEALPTEAYLKLFHQGMALNKQRVAEHLLILAEKIVSTRSEGITLVSLARAGTPIGVLLKHILQRYFGKSVPHYSISILRDIGIDQQALRYILQNNAPESLVFIDGWTGKGIIAEQLRVSLNDFAQRDGIEIKPELYVLTDLAGAAAVAASDEDYLIPSCLLNSTVSGLVSRTVYRPHMAELPHFHACVFYEHFRAHDLSKYFIDTLLEEVDYLWPRRPRFIESQLNYENLRNLSKQFLLGLAEQYAVSHVNYIKPGIGEASRVLLRREARLLLLQDPNAAATQHLRWLAESKGIPIAVVSESPYQAVALIKEISK